ncbi:hypothetical protein NC652_028855 [Populus alba x Populus x berolinensis]|nr:hypothetical protein NC652_028855 [Populus alba x Populus x berolinensis]
MPEECSNGEAPPLPPSNFIAGDDSTLFEEGFGWKDVAIGYGCGFMFGVIMGYVVFKTRRPAWFLKMVEDQWSLMQAEQRRMLVEMVQEETKQCSQYLQCSFCCASSDTEWSWLWNNTKVADS